MRERRLSGIWYSSNATNRGLSGWKKIFLTVSLVIDLFWSKRSLQEINKSSTIFGFWWSLCVPCFCTFQKLCHCPSPIAFEFLFNECNQSKLLHTCLFFKCVNVGRLSLHKCAHRELLQVFSGWPHLLLFRFSENSWAEWGLCRTKVSVRKKSDLIPSCLALHLGQFSESMPLPRYRSKSSHCSKFIDPLTQNVSRTFLSSYNSFLLRLSSPLEMEWNLLSFWGALYLATRHCNNATIPLVNFCHWSSW